MIAKLSRNCLKFRDRLSVVRDRGIAEFISAMPSIGYCIDIVLEILCSPFQTFRDEAAVTPGEEMVSIFTVPNAIATVVGPQEVLV